MLGQRRFPIHDSAIAQVFSPTNVPCALVLFVGLLSLFYRELPKLGMCKGKHRHCAVRLKIFGASTWQPETELITLTVL